MVVVENTAQLHNMVVCTLCQVRRRPGCGSVELDATGFKVDGMNANEHRNYTMTG